VFARGGLGGRPLIAAALSGALVVALFAHAEARAASGGAPGAGPTVPAIAWSEPTQVATGKGTRGPWKQNDSDYDYVDHPAVAMDPDGDVAVAWVDQRSKDVFLQIYGPGGEQRLAQPTNVSRSPESFSWFPRVEFTSDGGKSIAVLWQEIIFSGGPHGGEMYCARSTDGGRSFSLPTRLSHSVAGHGKGRLDYHTWDNGSFDLIAGEGNALYAAWTDWEGNLWVSRSTDGGASFSKEVQVPGTGWERPARGPSLAVGAGGVLVLAWAVGEDPSAEIQVSASHDGGRTFEPPRAAVQTPGRSDAPKIAADSSGAIHLVFAEMSGSPERARVLHARSEPGTLSFSAPRVVQGGGDPSRDAVFPDLAIGPDGAVYVVSEVLRSLPDNRQGLQLSVSTDGGNTFSGPELVPGSTSGGGGNGGLQGRFMHRLAAGSAARVAVGASRFQMDVASQVLVVRGERRER
jgi:hypothetical protein